MRPDSLRIPAQRLLGLLSWKPIAVIAVLAMALFAAPSFALVDEGVTGLENEKGNNGRGKGNGGGVLPNPGRGNGRGPVNAPVAPQVPVEPARPAAPAKPQAPPKPDPPKPKPAPAKPRAPKPDPTPARPQPTPERPKPTPTRSEPTPERPKPTPDRPQTRPEPTPARPQPTPDRPQTRPEPTPARPQPTPDRSQSTPSRPAPRPQTSAPLPVPTPSVPDGRVQVDGGGPIAIGRPPAATPGPAAPTPTAAPRSGGREEAPAPRIGGLVDSADRSLGGGTVPRPVTRGSRRATGGNGPATAPAVRAIRQDARGGVTYEVKAPGSRSKREVRVPGGVFGAMPAAGIQATQEVASAMEEGRTLGRATDSEEVGGVARVLSQPLAMVDDVTGGNVNGLLLAAVAALVAVALSVGIRRRTHHG